MTFQRKQRQDFEAAIAACLQPDPLVLTDLPGNLLELELPAEQLADRLAGLVTALKGQLLTLLASDRRAAEGHFCLHAALYFPVWGQTLLLRAAVPASLHYPAVTARLPEAEWAERELHDLFGICPQGMALEPLVLHRDWPRTQHPLRKDFELRQAYQVKDAAHIFDFHEPEGSHHVAVGPIHAGIIEPGHLRFCVTGEQVHAFSAQLFYTHKGLEKMAEGKSPREGLVLAENTCAQCALSHAVAYCQALEGLAGISPPPRALALRSLGLELERLANHAADLAAMGSAGGFGFAATRMASLREELMRLNKALSGHRFFRGWSALGGFRRDVPAETLSQLGERLQELRLLQQEWGELVASSSGFLDRVETTGQLSREQAEGLGLVGVAARASGVGRDLRIDRPYAAYELYRPSLALRSHGDARARMDVRLDEMASSFGLLAALLSQLPPGPVRAELPARLPAGLPGLGAVESSRGSLLHWVELDEQQQISRWHVRSAAYLNWRGVVQASMGRNIVPDGPLINKSFNLCYACVDR